MGVYLEKATKCDSVGQINSFFPALTVRMLLKVFSQSRLSFVNFAKTSEKFSNRSVVSGIHCKQSELKKR